MPWEHLSNHSEILAVHAAYMGFGQILYFGGDEHDPDHARLHQFDATRLFDCNTYAVTNPGSPPFDAFCSGHAFLLAVNQVKLLVAGGTEQFPEQGQVLHHEHFPGLRDAAIFLSPQFAAPGGGFAWTKAPKMNTGTLAAPGVQPNPDPQKTGGRWYPTLLTLASGDVIAMSGHPGSSDATHGNNIPEVFSIRTDPKGKWRRLAPYLAGGAAPGDYDRNAMSFYPRLHLLPTGDILSTNPIREDTWTFLPDVGPNGGQYFHVCRFPNVDAQEYNAFSKPSVLLPLSFEDNWQARALVCGSNQAWILDLRGWRNPPSGVTSWSWHATSARHPAPFRRNSNAVILPTGEIFVCGGIDISQPGFDQLNAAKAPSQPNSKGVQDPEIYDPFTDQWTWPRDPAPTVRNYHSVALLMPDGRVWVAGSDTDANPGLAARNLDIDIYQPWYHGNPKRPFIKGAPSLAYPGESIVVKSTNPDEIQRVVMVRCGTSTHSFDPDQRYLNLKFRHVVDDILVVDMPPNNNILPPGPYLIYTLRRDRNPLGLPSYGAQIYIVAPHDPRHG